MARTTLTADQAATVTARTTYTKESYKAVFDEILEDGDAVGNLESEFPLVKPAHVAWIFRNLLKTGGITDWAVAKSDDYGIVLKPVS